MRYRDPVKLADSLEELHPDVLIIRFEDYPLHWELLAAEILCSAELRLARIIVFAAAEVDAEHIYPMLSCISEKAGRPDTGRLSLDSAKMLSQLLGSATAAQHSPSTGSAPPPPSSSLIAAARKQAGS